MNINEFIKIGDRVKCTNDVDSCPTLNKIGTVKAVKKIGLVIHFDENIGGWDSDNLGIPNGHGLYVGAEDVELVDVGDKVKVIFARKNKEVKMPSKIAENAGLDVYAYFEGDEFIFQPHQTKSVPTGLYSCVTDDYVLLGRERGSTGGIGMKLGAGVIDSGYRGEIFIAITNDNDKPLVISKSIKETTIGKDFILYPYAKAIAQLLIVPVPKIEIVELTVEELKLIPSKRGETCLGQSGK